MMHLPKLLLLLLCALPWLSVSCIYRSQIENRNFRTPDRYQHQKATSKTARRNTAPWWKLFDDPTLNRLVDAAFTQSYDLEIMKARIEQARAGVTAATAGWFPSITATGDASKSESVFNLPDRFGGGVQKVSSESVQLSLAASYEIDIWGKVRYARNAAKHALTASETDLLAAYVSVAATVADLYFLVVQQREQLALLDKTIEIRTSQTSIVRERYRSGVAQPSDLYQAQQSLADAQAQRAQAAGSLKTALNALAVAVGRYPGEINAGTLDKLPSAIKEVQSGIPANLLLQRPDLRSARQRLLAVDSQVGAALAAHFPSISIGGSVGGRFVPSPTSFIWNLFANLTAPLFNGGQIDAQYRKQKAVLRETIAGFKKTLLTAVKEVEDAIATGRALEKQIVWLEKRVESLEGALRLTMDQYVQGLNGYLNVLTSEQALLASRSALITARRSLIASRITLARAVGGSWVESFASRKENQKTSAASKAPKAKSAQRKGS